MYIYLARSFLRGFKWRVKLWEQSENGRRNILPQEDQKWGTWGFRELSLIPSCPEGIPVWPSKWHTCSCLAVCHISVWWTLLWGWFNHQLFRMAACFPPQICSNVYLTYLEPRKSIINRFKCVFDTFSLPKPGNTSSHQNLKACPAWAQLCL